MGRILPYKQLICKPYRTYLKIETALTTSKSKNIFRKHFCTLHVSREDFVFLSTPHLPTMLW